LEVIKLASAVRWRSMAADRQPRARGAGLRHPPSATTPVHQGAGADLRQEEAWTRGSGQGKTTGFTTDPVKAVAESEAGSASSQESSLNGGKTEATVGDSPSRSSASIFWAEAAAAQQAPINAPTSPNSVEDHWPGASPLFSRDGASKLLVLALLQEKSLCHTVTGPGAAGLCWGSSQAPWLVNGSFQLACWMRQGSRRTEKAMVMDCVRSARD